MSTRFTEDDLTQFQRNSGRGLPEKTLKEMSKAQGVQLDSNGAPIPKKRAGRKAKAETLSVAAYQKTTVPTEHEECVALMKWAATQRYKSWPLNEILVHIPNGAYHGADRRAAAVVARKLREEGTREGAFDYILPIPVLQAPVRTPGLWLEMKRRQGGVVSDEQKKFKARMEAMLWRCVIVKGWEEAVLAIKEHLRIVTAWR